MSEILDAIGKTTKKVADFLGVKEVSEPHHSEPYNEPKGEVSQVLANRPTTLTEQIDRGSNKREGYGLSYLKRVGSGGRK